jgi:hypothetical protein
MGNRPRLVLNEEEQALRDSDPEACLRHALRRGALSLDQVTASLSPHAGAVVHSIVTGEQLPEPGKPSGLGAVLRSIFTGERASESSGEETLPLQESASAQRLELEEQLAASWQADYQSLAAWPGLQRAVDEGVLTPVDALEIAHTIDGSLGRYMTGTRYAAP